MFFTEELKTKDDYINLLEEIEAYRSLDGLDFDFGTGLIINEMSYGSEDAYYKMDIQSLKEILEYWDYDHKKSFKTKRKPKTCRHYLKRKEKQKIERLSKISWSTVVDRDNWKQRCYRGSRSSYLKKQSNKAIRGYRNGLPAKGSMHHKIFDFWWELD